MSTVTYVIEYFFIFCKNESDLYMSKKTYKAFHREECLLMTLKKNVHAGEVKG